MNRWVVISSAAVLAIGTALALIVWPRPTVAPTAPNPNALPSATTSPLYTVAAPTSPAGQVVEPIDEFKSRITKKPFGIHITPATSPVQPERFSGYHTGVDVEYGDVSAAVPIRAVARGRVVRAGTVSGYGGVVVIEHTLPAQTVLALYGHLKPSRLPAVGATVSAGQEIGVLGEGGTPETDGERKHLHFAILTSTTLDLRGYVANQAELGRWLNPLTLFE
jgi:murein DD-endopeptidase MepM/ murein hydrolase activator NlpD